MDILVDAPVVGNIPTMRYARSFLSTAQQASLMDKILTSKTWVQLKNRKLQQWGGTPEEKGMISSKLPEWLDSISQRLVETKCVPERPNHVLVNSYSPGEGIMPHEDGPLVSRREFAFESHGRQYKPHFVIISLGSSLLLEFYAKNSDDKPLSLDERKVCSVLLEPGSCLIISEVGSVWGGRLMFLRFIFFKDAYLNYLHGISERTIDVLDETVCNLHLVDPDLREKKVCSFI